MKNTRNPAVSNSQSDYEQGQEFMYSLLRSQYPEEAGLVLEYFQNDGFLSRSEIADIEGKGKVQQGALRAILNEKVKEKTGRSFLEKKEVGMVSAILAVLPVALGLEQSVGAGTRNILKR